MPKLIPDFIIIGAQKSASSFLQGCIDEHPDVAIVEGETALLEEEDYSEHKLHQLIQEFSKSHPDKLIGIKRPNYLAIPLVADRIYDLNPDMKLIAVLRDPIDRLLSAYFHYMRDGFIPLVDPNIGIPKLLSGEWVKKYPRSVQLLEYGNYSTHLEYYYSKFSPNQILLFTQREVISDPVVAAQKVYKFLGVDAEFIPSQGITKRPQAVVYSIPRLRLINIRTRIKNTYNKSHTRIYPKSHLNFVDRFLVRAINSFDARVMQKFFLNNKPTLSTQLKAQLKEYYAEEIRNLARITNLDLSDWKY